MVAGQTASSLAVDRVGLSPIGRTRVTRPRLVAAAVAVVAVVVAVSGRLGVADLQPVALALAFVAGCVVAVQQALNGRVNTATLQPLSTTWLNFLFGSAILLVMALVGLAALGAQVQPPTSGPWWMWLGGVFGIVFIVTGAWAVPRYGVLMFALVTIAGQLAAALVLDVVAPLGANSVQWTLVLGVILTFLSVGIIAVRSR
jgi:bacterial/archaeal transporter family-2 protein